MNESKIIGVLLIALFISVTVNIYHVIPKEYLFEDYAVETELKEHLETNTNEIELHSITVFSKNLDGSYSFRVNCYNNVADVFFSQDCTFNPETKKIDGYNVLKYI